MVYCKKTAHNLADARFFGITAREAKAGLEGKEDTMLFLAAGTGPSCVATLWVKAKQQMLDNIPDNSSHKV
jgi:hypothetical protein